MRSIKERVAEELRAAKRHLGALPEGAAFFDVQGPGWEEVAEKVEALADENEHIRRWLAGEYEQARRAAAASKRKQEAPESKSPESKSPRKRRKRRGEPDE